HGAQLNRSPGSAQRLLFVTKSSLYHAKITDQLRIVRLLGQLFHHPVVRELKGRLCSDRISFCSGRHPIKKRISIAFFVRNRSITQQLRSAREISHEHRRPNVLVKNAHAGRRLFKNGASLCEFAQSNQSLALEPPKISCLCDRRFDSFVREPFGVIKSANREVAFYELVDCKRVLWIELHRCLAIANCILPTSNPSLR